MRLRSYRWQWILTIITVTTLLWIYRADWTGLLPGQKAADMKPGSASQPPVPERKVKVVLAPVQSGVVDESVSAVGTLLADEAVLIKPELPGRVDRIGFTEGQTVLRGTELFHLAAEEQRANLAQSQAELELARHNFDRAGEMHKHQHIAQQDFDETIAKMKFAEAAVERNRAILDKMSIRAPFSGVMGLRQVSLGDYVEKGQMLVNLESMQMLKLDFRVPEKYLPLVKTGQAVTLSVAAFPDQPFTGEIIALDPRLDESSRTLKIRAQLGNPEFQLRPGMFAKVDLTPGTIRKGLWLPEAALVVKGSTSSVFKYVEGRVHLLVIHIGSRQHGQVEVLSGLSEGDQVVVEGHARLRENAAVDVLQDFQD